MISVARKNLFADKPKLILAIGGVAFSAFMIMILLGVYDGVRAQVKRYVVKTQADLWVMQEGTNDMFHSISILPDNLKNQIERKVGNGSTVYPLIARATQLTIRHHNELLTKRQREKQKNDITAVKATINLVGYDPDSGIGGPWEMKEGRTDIKKNEVIIDSMLAKNKKIRIGDDVEILGDLFNVVGISEDTNLVVEQMVFMHLKEAQDLLGFKEKVNYYLINLSDPQRLAEMQDKLETEIPKIQVRTRKQFADKNSEIVEETYTPIIFTIVVIGFLVGSIVVGLTIYTSTVEKIREFGILKAIGASNSTLYKVVFEQSLWIVVIGFTVGVLLTKGVIPIIQQFVAMNIAFDMSIVLRTFIATLFMSVVSSYVPIRKIAGLDPVMVFKA